MSCHLYSNHVLAGMGLGGGGNGKGSGVEIADGELGSGDGRGEAERSLEKRLSYLLRRTCQIREQRRFHWRSAFNSN